MARIRNSLAAVALVAALLSALSARATTYFVDGTAGNDANGCTNWGADVCQTVTRALSLTTPTIIAVGSTGTFTKGGAITWTLPATSIDIISATNPGSGTAITPAAGATFAIGAANNAFTITGANGTALYMSGMHIVSSTGGSSGAIALGSAASANYAMDITGSTFELANSSATLFDIGTLGGSNIFPPSIRIGNSTILVSGSRAGTVIGIGTGYIELIGDSVSLTGATTPVTLFAAQSGASQGSLTVRDSDLSGFNTAASAYFAVATFNQRATLENVKFSSTPTLTSGSWTSGGSGSVTLRNVDSANTTYKFEYHDPYGDLSTDSGNYMSGTLGFNGTALAWKVVTSANASEEHPFRVPIIDLFNTSTASQSLNVEFAQNSSATALTDQQVWSSLDYPSSSSFPTGSTVTNRNAAPITGTPANQTSSGKTWVGLTTPTTQKLVSTFTAAVAGTVQGFVSVGDPGTTLWINPWLTQ